MAKTPKTPREFLDLTHALSQDDGVNASTRRFLFKKIQKAYQDQLILVGEYEGKIEGLNHKIAKLQPMKRKKVRPNPNKDFVDLLAIQKVKTGLVLPGARQTRNRTAIRLRIGVDDEEDVLSSIEVKA